MKVRHLVLKRDRVYLLLGIARRDHITDERADGRSESKEDKKLVLSKGKV